MNHLVTPPGVTNEI